MDRYKKKNLKFMGKGPEVRAVEMNAARGSVRQQRFSLQRPLEDACQPSKVPTLGIPKLQSRIEMLRKWKEEKDLKKRLEALSKKPPFKGGGTKSEVHSSESSSRIQAIKASRILPASGLANVHQKAETSKPEMKTCATKVQRVPSTKPLVSGLQGNKPGPVTKPQIAKPPATRTGPVTKPQIAKPAATRTNIPIASLKSHSNSDVKGTKIQISRVKPMSFLPQKKLPNQQTGLKNVSSLPIKKAVKAVEPPKKVPEEKDQAGSSSSERSLFPECELSVLEREKSFAPPDFEFCPLKISSWLEDEGPCAIYNKLLDHMNVKQRTSTPLKDTTEHKESKEQERAGAKENSSIPYSDEQEIEALNDRPEAKLPEEERAEKEQEIEALNDSPEAKLPEAKLPEAKLPEAKLPEAKLPEAKSDAKAVFTFSLTSSPENVESAAAEVLTDIEQEEGDILSIKQKMDNLLLSKDSVELVDLPAKIVDEPALSNEERAPVEASLIRKPLIPNPPERSTGRLLSSNYRRMGKPSLALIAESPERSATETPKLRRRKCHVEGFTPRRSQRLASRSDLKVEEEDIFKVEECFLDSPTVEAATRMSMGWDFDKLHLEASSQGNSNGGLSTRANRGKVSLLYTPPRLRQSTRNKSLKGDLMTFSPSVE